MLSKKFCFTIRFRKLLTKDALTSVYHQYSLKALKRKQFKIAKTYSKLARAVHERDHVTGVKS